MAEAKPSALIEGGGSARSFVAWFRERSRHRRVELFRRFFKVNESTRLLDLGGWNGVHINAVVHGLPIPPSNVHVADISAQAVDQARVRFGFTPVVLPESGPLPFDSGAFDIVFCSSVLEHVTIPKTEIWHVSDAVAFNQRARAHQRAFAAEIARVGHGYFVQVPYRGFPVETHTWLPLFAQLPRPWQIALMRQTNRFWIKKTSPDFYLPTKDELAGYFPGALVELERSGGFVKSLIAIKTSTYSK